MTTSTEKIRWLPPWLWRQYFDVHVGHNAYDQAYRGDTMLPNSEDLQVTEKQDITADQSEVPSHVSSYAASSLQP